MDEHGFDFKPVEKRDPRRFEPPPWERDAFERREREKERASETEVRLKEPPAQEEEAPEVTAVEAETPPKVAKEAPKLDEARVTEMLAALNVEDPPVDTRHGKVAVAVSLGTMALGAVLIMWGMAAFVGARDTGLFGRVTGVGLATFGAFFVGAGSWLLYRTLKQQGVL